MSDDDQSRMADIKILKEKGSTFYKIRVTLLGHITAEIRWDDAIEEGRSDVCALLRDSVDMAKGAFLEIEVDREAMGLDEELAELFGFFGHGDLDAPTEDEESE